ncbi:MAG: ABC transporter ATP-binding protein [Alphaproteobacteria bacterium]|nr:ABC transporter ATP-binding protein [Alphaproteobacteria bacterium]
MILLALFWSTIEAFIPFVLKLGIDSLTMSPRSKGLIAQEYLKEILWFFLICICLTELAMRLCNYLYLKVVPTLCKEVEQKVVSRLLMQTNNKLNKEANPESHHIKNISSSLETMIRLTIYGILPIVWSYFITAMILTQISVWATLLYVLWFVGMVCLSLTSRRKLIDLSEEVLKHQNIFLNEIYDALLNLSVIKRFKQEPFEFIRNKVYQLRYYETLNKEHKYVLLLNILRSALTLLLVGITTWITITLLTTNNIRIGDVAFLMIATLSMRRDTWVASYFMMDVLKQFGIFKASIDNIPNTIFDKNVLFQQKVPVDILLESVDFKYREKPFLFNQLDCHIPFNQKVAIIGNSGAGKSTLVDLIIGKVRPDSGKITFNAHYLRSEKNYHPELFHIAQAEGFFNRSIYENMTYGLHEKPTRKALKQAILDAKATKFYNVNLLLNNEQSRVDNLSGGEKQKILLVRCLLHQSKVIILDEATSALDIKSECDIIKTLIRKKSENTIIFVGHRVPVLKYFDRIIVIDKGSIIEDGTHQELLDRKGEYYSLWKTAQEI